MDRGRYDATFNSVKLNGTVMKIVRGAEDSMEEGEEEGEEKGGPIERGEKTRQRVERFGNRGADK